MACTAAASAARRSPASCRRCARSRSPTRARCSDASSADRALSTPWDARTYDRTSGIVGRSSELPKLALPEQAMDEEEPAAVLTLGRLRLRNALRFLRASAAAE